MVSMVAVAETGCGGNTDTASGSEADKTAETEINATDGWNASNEITIVSREEGSGTRMEILFPNGSREISGVGMQE